MMKRNLLSILVVSGALAANQGIAAPVTLADEYIGWKDHGYGDVIGEVGKFQIFGVSVDLVGTQLSIEINTNFANSGLGTFAPYTRWGKGIGFGDLFLAAAWTPYDNGTTSTAANGYLGDNYLTGTNWDYGFSLGDSLLAQSNRWSPTGGVGTWYDLTGDGQNGAVLLSDYYMSGGSGSATYRNGQEVGVDTANANAQALMTGNWYVDAVNHKVGFSFDIAGTTLENSDTIALHWSMTCGNDTIEAVFRKPVSAPEPGALALFVLSLLSMLGLRRPFGQFRKSQAAR